MKTLLSGKRCCMSLQFCYYEFDKMYYLVICVCVCEMFIETLPWTESLISVKTLLFVVWCTCLERFS